MIKYFENFTLVDLLLNFFCLDEKFFLFFAEKNYLPNINKCFEINVTNMSRDEMKWNTKTFEINLDLYTSKYVFLHILHNIYNKTIENLL